MFDIIIVFIMTIMTTELICVYAMTMFYFSVLPQRNDEDVIFRTGGVCGRVCFYMFGK